MSATRRWFLQSLSAVLPLGALSAWAAPRVTTPTQADGAEANGIRANAIQAEGAAPRDEDAAGAKQAALEEAFTRKMSGCVFNGSYSVTTGAEEKSAVMEKYTIEKVARQQGELWLFNARWLIGKSDIPIALPLTIKWAGDTPVITLDNVTIPGLGTFSSRVLIHEEWYAGTWRHDKVGGHLWGRIERAKAAAEPPAGDSQAPDPQAPNPKTPNPKTTGKPVTGKPAGAKVGGPN